MKKTLFAVALAIVGSVYADKICFAPGCAVSNGDADLSLSMTWDVPGPMMARLEGSPFPDEKSGLRKFHLGAARNGIDPDADGTLKAEFLANGSLTLDFSLVAPKEQEIFDIFLSGSVGVATYGGGWFLADDKRIDFPKECDKKHVLLFHGWVKRLEMFDPTGVRRSAITYSQKQEIDIKDSRGWGSTRFVLYQYLRRGGKVNAGETMGISLKLRGRTPLTDDSKMRIISAGQDWVPMTFDREILAGSACDFSSQIGIDAPAGKYGFVVAKGENFEFERRPGKPVRFYGNNICWKIPQVPREKARKLAAELKKNGYNAIRLHYWDICMTEGVKDGTTIPEERLVAFDGFMKEMIDAGIYVATDLYTSRAVPFREVGIERDGMIPMDTYKELLFVHEGVRKNLERYVRQLLTHVNPFTGRDYAHEPALAWYCFVNEGDAGNFGKRNMDEFPEFKAAWKRYLAAAKSRFPEYANLTDEIPAAFQANDPAGNAVRGFLRKLETDFDLHMKGFVRSLGSKALVSSMNAWFNPISYQLIREDVYDYVDDHFYIDHPLFIGKGRRSFPTRCQGLNPVKDTRLGVPGVVGRRLLNKPFTITEYNHSVPGEYRGGGAMMIGAFAALQNWAGMWRFCFGKEAERIDDPNPFKITFHDTWSDPMMRASEYLFSALFLRRDIEPLDERIVVAYDRKDLESAMPGSQISQWWPWHSLCWRAKTGTLIGEKPKDAIWGFSNAKDAMAKSLPDAKAELFRGGEVRFAGGKVRIDEQAGTFAVDTARTSGVFGERGRIDGGFLMADLGEVPAAVWAVSVDGENLTDAKRILVGHLTDCEDSGTEFFGSGVQYLKKWGKPPHLIRNGRAEIELRLKADGYEVWALSSGGRRLAKVPTVERNGKLAFVADVARDPKNATWLYEVMKMKETK